MKSNKKIVKNPTDRPDWIHLLYLGDINELLEKVENLKKVKK